MSTTSNGKLRLSVELSIVVPVVNEAAALERFVAAVDAVLPSLGLSGHEYVFVDGRTQFSRSAPSRCRR
jgi:PII-like signaling protein